MISGLCLLSWLLKSHGNSLNCHGKLIELYYQISVGTLYLISMQKELLLRLIWHCDAIATQKTWWFARVRSDVHCWLAVASLSVSLSRQVGTGFNSTVMLLSGVFWDCSQRLLTADTVSADKIGRVNGPLAMPLLIWAENYAGRRVINSVSQVSSIWTAHWH